MVTNATEVTNVGDVVKHELNGNMSRRKRFVDESQTLVVGTVCGAGPGGRKVAITAPGDEVQLIGITGSLSAGSFNLTFRDPDGALITTDPIAYGANTAGVQTGVDTAIGGSNVTVAGTTITAMTFTFDGGEYAGKPQPLIGIDVSDLTGEEDTSVSRTAVGGTGGIAEDEIQLLAIVGTLTSGTFTISAEDAKGTVLTTATIAYNANTAAIQSALDTTFGSNAIVAGGTAITASTLTFSGDDFQNRPQAMHSADGALLVGMESVTSSRTTAGGPAGTGLADSICIEAVTTAGSAKSTEALFLERNAIVNKTKLAWGTANWNDVEEALLALGIQVQDDQ